MSALPSIPGITSPPQGSGSPEGPNPKRSSGSAVSAAKLASSSTRENINARFDSQILIAPTREKKMQLAIRKCCMSTLFCCCAIGLSRTENKTDNCCVKGIKRFWKFECSCDCFNMECAIKCSWVQKKTLGCVAKISNCLAKVTPPCCCSLKDNQVVPFGAVLPNGEFPPHQEME